MRLDLYLVRFSGVKTRNKAKILIKNGFVYVDGRLIIKPAYDVKYDDRVEIKYDKDTNRGYLKLKYIDENLEEIVQDLHLITYLSHQLVKRILSADKVKGEIHAK